MVAVSNQERAALEAVLKADQEEQNRSRWWGIISREDKARALMVAHMDKRRAVDPLNTFTPEERGLIACALGAHRAKMDLISMVMGIGADVAAKARSDAAEQARADFEYNTIPTVH